ncbi:phage integrase SAM-like domain-containing protein [Mycobacterium marinum]|nr:phage integrase SAM-like domain-containing protein [Mycobacterium marinum]
MGEYAQPWLDSKHKLKESTRARYQVVLDTALAKYADVALGDISRRFIREWVADLSADLAPASVHKTVGVLRQILAMAVEDNRLAMKPAEGVEIPSVRAAEQRFLTLEQLPHPGRRFRRPSPAGVRVGDVWAAVRRSRRAALARYRHR